MFNYINGSVAEKGPNYLVIDINGIGFKIFTSVTTLQDTSVLIGEKSTIYTYLYLKEGIMDLYGFSSKEELSLFELLITVSGVGAKGAVSILSVAAPQKIAMAIISGDTALIKQASGIGTKTAQRISLELKDKINSEGVVDSALPEGQVQMYGNGGNSEAVSALVVLGYSQGEAQRAVASVDPSVTNTEEIIKQALKKLF